jgi:hypothetical protein
MKKATPWNWESHIGERKTFFETEKGGRILRVRVYLRPQEEGNILWYLATKTKSGHWSKFILKLEEMEELGFLFLLLSKFCGETLWMDRESFAKIQNLKKVWENLQANSEK